MTRLAVIAAAVALGPLSAPFALAAAHYWRSGNRALAVLCAMGVPCVWLLSGWLTTALLAWDAHHLGVRL